MRRLDIELQKVSNSPSGISLPVLLRMLTGRFHNKRQVLHQAHDNVEISQRSPLIQISVWPMHIDTLPSDVKAVFIRVAVGLPNRTEILPGINTYQVVPGQTDSMIRQVLYTFKDRSKYTDVAPSSLTDFDLSENSNDVATNKDCDTFWRVDSEGEGFVSNGTFANCYIDSMEPVSVEVPKGVVIKQKANLRSAAYPFILGFFPPIM